MSQFVDPYAVAAEKAPEPKAPTVVVVQETNVDVQVNRQADTVVYNNVNHSDSGFDTGVCLGCLSTYAACLCCCTVM